MTDIDRSLIADYQRFHSDGTYGLGGKHLPWLLPQLLALRPASLLDYGAGRSEIALRLGEKARIRRVARFEPAVSELQRRPAETFDVVMSLDVLEHIPDEELDAVLAEMAALGRHQLHIIDIRPAKAILADGRNAHVSLHSGEWWETRMQRHMPQIRRVACSRPDRVALRSWPQELPAWRRWFIERREKLLLSIRKRPFTALKNRSIRVRADDQLKADLERLAAADSRQLSAYVLKVLRAHVASSKDRKR